MSPSSTPRWRMLAYSAGALGSTLTGQVVSGFVAFFYLDRLRLDPRLYGIGMTVYAIWNALNDPLAGQVSDRTRSRWGRRRPYVLLLTPLLVLAFVAVWTPPVGPERQSLLFAYFLGVLLAFDTLWTFVVLNWTALYPEMFEDERERATVSGWRQFFSVIGLILVEGLTLMLADRLGWATMALLVGAGAALFFYLSVWGSRENPAFAGEAVGLREALRLTLSHRSFLLFLGFNVAVQYCFQVLTVALPFYIKYVLALPPGGTETALLLAVPFMTAMPMLFLWTRVIHRFGAWQAAIAGCITFGVALVPFLVIRSFGWALPATIGAAFGLAPLLMLPDILLASVVDEDELRSGRRREGMYFGINGFAIRLAIALQGLTLSTVFRLSGYVPDAGIGGQPPSAVWGLRLLMGAIPWIGLGLALVSLAFYPLRGERLMDLKARVAARHEQLEA